MQRRKTGNARIITGIIIFLVILGGALAYFLSSSQFNIPLKEKAASQEEEGPGIGLLDDQSEGVPESEKGFNADLKEYEVQDAIHLMSHQKVKADQKWGSLLITEERISQLIEIVENHKDDYDHAGLYLEILQAWQAGDFSHADDDHNAIWMLQDGTIGEATGVLSEKQEQEYIEKNF